MASAESSNSPPAHTSETKLLSEHQTNIIISEKEAAAAASAAAQGTTGFTPKLEWLDTLTTIKKESSYSQNETNSKYIEQYVATLDRFIEKLENRKKDKPDGPGAVSQFSGLAGLSGTFLPPLTPAPQQGL